MTDREKAIVMAYTGICMLEGKKLDAFYQYLAELYGRPVYTHEWLTLDIKEKSRPDFIKLCEEEQAERKKGEWIPCSKRLPENRRYVLVTYQYEYGLIDHGITWYGEAEKKWDTSRNVIAWMPLPEPYRGE